MPDFGDLLHVHAIPDDRPTMRSSRAPAFPQPSFYLLRPDGHIGLCGTRLDAAALARYAAEQLRLG